MRERFLAISATARDTDGFDVSPLRLTPDQLAVAFQAAFLQQANDEAVL